MDMFKSEAMSDTNLREGEVLPKGRVNEVCREWLVREDGALAYRLQNEEISEHLSGNKFRNAVVREDFPRAKNEQLREQQLAEQTAMIYHQMLAEQEEHDKLVAKQLTEELEREERQKRRVLEVHDQDLVRHLLDKERVKVERHQAIPHSFSPQRPPPPRGYDGHPSPHRPDPQNYEANLPLSSRRQAKAMPLPQLEANNLNRIIDESPRKLKELELARKFPKPTNIPQYQDTYSEPYKAADVLLADNFDKIALADNIGLPVDEFIEKQIQEEKDAELARQLQEEEGSLEDTLLNRDRMLAIEAQDKELAKLLQERERTKARRARERAKQKALAKKQQQLEAQQGSGSNQLMPDDSYSYPADLIPPRNSMPRHPEVCDTYSLPHHEEDVNNYSLPADVLPVHSFADGMKVTCSPQKYGSKTNGADNIRVPLYDQERVENVPAIRPTQLDLRSPLNRINKPRYPEPESCEPSSIPSSASSPSQHVNIAMAIDPTYTRRGIPSSSSYDTTASTVTTSTSSSSPGMVLPPPDIAELDDENVVPPYMPIQGQRRTGSLEKKSKKKSKEGGCKQQ